jgi:hypothetical protein
LIDVLREIANHVGMCRLAYPQAAAADNGFGHLIVVVRDADIFGLSEDNCRTRLFENDHNPGNNVLREVIRSAFTSFHLICLPRPFSDENCRRDPQFAPSLAVPAFLSGVKRLQELITEVVRVPRTLQNTILTGSMIYNLLNVIVPLTNQFGQDFRLSATACEVIQVNMLQGKLKSAISQVNATVQALTSVYDPGCLRDQCEELVLPIRQDFADQILYFSPYIPQSGIEELTTYITQQINVKCDNNVAIIERILLDTRVRSIPRFQNHFLARVKNQQSLPAAGPATNQLVEGLYQEEVTAFLNSLVLWNHQNPIWKQLMIEYHPNLERVVQSRWCDWNIGRDFIQGLRTHLTSMNQGGFKPTTIQQAINFLEQRRTDELNAALAHWRTLRINSDRMTVAQAKTLYPANTWVNATDREFRQDREEVVAVLVERCTCDWPSNYCLLKRLQEPLVVHSFEVLASSIENECVLRPSFRGGRCPKTGCDDGGTRGGWCANIMSDGTPHCLHYWCHSPLCKATTHFCVVQRHPVFSGVN